MDRLYAASYNGRGLVLDKLGNHEESFKNFTKAMNLETNNPVFIHNRACCLRNMGRYRSYHDLRIHFSILD